jgi:PAS domain S-box-containing protein
MIPFKLIIGFLFGLLVAGVSVLGIISLQNSQASDRTAASVKHTYEVLGSIQDLVSLYKDIQLESNAFVITRDSTLLSLYNKAKANLFMNIKHIRFAMRDNEEQQQRIDTLFGDLRNLVHFTDSLQGVIPDHSEVEHATRFSRHRNFRVVIGKTLRNIETAEMALLVQREKENQKNVTAFHNTFSLMLVAIFGLVAAAFFSIRYNFNKRTRAELDLKRANDLFKTLFNETPVGMVISRVKDGVITDCNHAFSRLTNYSRREMVGETTVGLGLLDRKEQENENEKLANVFVEENARDIEMEIRPKDGSPIWVSISTQLIDVNDEQHLLSALVDMTAHKELEEKMKNALATEIELNKMKSNFVSLASHEFRTPLTSILSSTSLLERYSYGEHQEKASRHITRIKSSVKNLTTILDEFLSISKIEEGKITPKIEQVNIKEYLERICVGFHGFTKRDQEVFYHHQGLEEVYTDPVLLGNIINNLVSNAIKYSPEGRSVYVTSHVNGKLCIEVKDQGIGIPKEEQKYLYNRFFRASNTGTAQGTGLGLHIMKHYVEMLHGQVELNSEVGKGSTFTVAFDLPPAEQ